MIGTLLSLALICTQDPSVGTTGFNFLKITPTAREAAMGSAAIGFGDDAFGLWYNPAGLAGQRTSEAGLGYISYVGGVQSGVLSYVTPVKDKTFGLGAYFLNSGAMKRTDDMGDELGTFTTSFLDINGAGAWQLSKALAVGAGLKLIYGGIDSFSSIAVGVDLSAKYLLTKDLWGSAVVHNLGLTVKAFETQADKLPMDIAVGFGYAPIRDVRLDLELHKPSDNNINVRLGGEAWVTKNICLRAGLTTPSSDLQYGGGSDIAAGISLGLGFKVSHVVVDYAFTPMIVLGNTHRISLQYSF